MGTYYVVDLSVSRDCDYTKGDTVVLAIISTRYPNAEEIETYLKKTNNRFAHLYVCNICEIDRMEDVIPFVEEIIDID